MAYLPSHSAMTPPVLAKGTPESTSNAWRTLPKAMKVRMTLGLAFGSTQLTVEESIATLGSASVCCSRGYDFGALLRNRPAMAGPPINRLDSYDRGLFEKRVAVRGNFQNARRRSPLFSLPDR